MSNSHQSNPATGTHVTFISGEERAAGVDPAAIAAQTARAVGATNHAGLNVRMFDRNGAPIDPNKPTAATSTTRGTPPRPSHATAELQLVVLTGLEAIQYAQKHNTRLLVRNPSSGLIDEVDPLQAFASGLPDARTLANYHTQARRDVLGRDPLPTFVPPAPVPTGVPSSSAPTGAGGAEHMSQAQELASAIIAAAREPQAHSHIPEAHSMAAFVRHAGPQPQVQMTQRVRIQVAAQHRVVGVLQRDGEVIVQIASVPVPVSAVRSTYDAVRVYNEAHTDEEAAADLVDYVTGED